MKKHTILLLSGIFVVSFLILSNSIAFAKQKPAQDDFIRNAYKQICSAADKNGDGKLSMNECTSISKDKKKIEKDCKYWDANGDGFITEDEYVKQAGKIMR